jgi:hypothetical protein
MSGTAVAPRSGERRRYTLRVVRSVEREFGFAEQPHNVLNSARLERSDSPAARGAAG